ncbi:response regulator [Lysinibacillus sphaericus]|nr:MULTISPECIES: ATP-binding protein [Lysinibacillus]MBE5083292.1 response regulator [Bacillus thuringiensis]MBG9711393.1 ethylene receptor [Lysinibacillus sphaericus]MBG9727876.1 ethylene receptor [Lysinibacillus fusiformis]MBG9731693.1 ethylene receptor [Lysinibacillus sphaericus]MBG9740762.1 ethylene receptor [Lysinibacillus sphaericus]
MKHRIMAIIILFIVLLTGSRMLWLHSFTQPDQPSAIKGQIDVRDFDFQHDALTLDGEWSFHPSQWLMDHQSSNHSYIQVPDGWDNVFRKGEQSPFGYGSYQLKILVNTEEARTFSLRVPSIRSAAEIYVNDRLIAKSGELGENRAQTMAKNIPFTASFEINGESEIELVIQVANFQDPRNGGIVRSIKFGQEDVINRETQLSITMQLFVAVVLVLHAIYSVILYLVGNKDKRLLFFSILTVNIMFYYLLGSDDKLLSFWFPINYDWGFILVHLSMVGIGYSLLQCIEHWLPPHLQHYKRMYTFFCLVAILLAFTLPIRYLVSIQAFYMVILGAPIVITLILMTGKSIKDIRSNVFILLGLVAFVNSILWDVMLLITGIKVISYPFDLMVTIACLATLWFKDYAKVHADTKKLAHKLQETDKIKDEFLASTSHELRNPLHSIINMSKAVLDREANRLTAKSVTDLETVLSVGNRMSLLLNDLLDVVSLKDNTQQLQLSRVSIHSIAVGVFDMLRFMIEGKPVQFVLKIPEDFQRVLADENRVIQIVFNLVHNAVKFTNEGSITISSYTRNGMANIVITDTGIGVDDETMRRIFERYEQGTISKTMVEGGFGLGLNICKRLIELHGGTLKAQSIVGQGSTFTFTLPLAVESNVQEPLEKGRQSVSKIPERITPLQTDLEHEQSTEFNHPRILVVDDEPINLRVVETILANEPYDIVTVTSGIEALVCIQSHEWDLVISDVMMPKMSGYELVRLIRKQFSITDLPVLLLTARSQPQDLENGFLAGANDYVTKPVDALELRSRVAALIKVKRSIQERHRMEAAWLQAQIEPHFLFNTLNAILTLSEMDSERTSRLVEALSDFLRESYNFQNVEALVPLENELTLIQAYLYIQQERFGDRIQVKWDLEASTDVLIPSLTIQPLVENALQHGILKRTEGGTIHIRIYESESQLEITVSDNGVGIDEQRLSQLLQTKQQPSGSIGLMNTHLRLQQHYGQGLHITSKLHEGTAVSFVVLVKKPVKQNA